MKLDVVQVCNVASEPKSVVLNRKSAVKFRYDAPTKVCNSDILGYSMICGNCLGDLFWLVGGLGMFRHGILLPIGSFLHGHRHAHTRTHARTHAHTHTHTHTHSLLSLPAFRYNPPKSFPCSTAGCKLHPSYHPSSSPTVSGCNPHPWLLPSLN